MGEFVVAHEGVSAALALAVSVGTGFLIESVGSYVEFYVVVDVQHDDRAAMLARWRHYPQVALAHGADPSTYLRRLLTTFKFELNPLVSAATLPGFAALTFFHMRNQA